MSHSNSDEENSPVLVNALGIEIMHLPEIAEPPLLPVDDQEEWVVVEPIPSSLSAADINGGFKQSTSVETINWRLPDENPVEVVLKSNLIAMDEDLFHEMLWNIVCVIVVDEIKCWPLGA